MTISNHEPGAPTSAVAAPTGIISTVQPEAGLPAASPPANKRLLPSLLVNSLMLFATYAGLIAILLPIQIATIDEGAKEANLAIVTTVSFVFTLFAQPIAGALSDRTRSRFGRRAPWMLAGAVVGAIFLFGIGSLHEVLWITFFWTVIQVALNFVQAPLTTITADRFPRSKRGGASAMVGIGMQLGGLLGVVLAGNWVSNLESAMPCSVWLCSWQPPYLWYSIPTGHRSTHSLILLAGRRFSPDSGSIRAGTQILVGRLPRGSC